MSYFYTFLYILWDHLVWRMLFYPQDIYGDDILKAVFLCYSICDNNDAD